MRGFGNQSNTTATKSLPHQCPASPKWRDKNRITTIYTYWRCQAHTMSSPTMGMGNVPYLGPSSTSEIGSLNQKVPLLQDLPLESFSLLRKKGLRFPSEQLSHPVSGQYGKLGPQRTPILLHFLFQSRLEVFRQHNYFKMVQVFYESYCVPEAHPRYSLAQLLPTLGLLGWYGPARFLDALTFQL